MVVVLITAGDQLPVIPFGDVFAKIGVAEPEQILGIGAKFGVTIGLTLIVKVVVVAHCPDDGVKVYNVVEVLFNAGDQEPVIPLVEVVGNGVSIVPVQIGETEINVGKTFEFIVIVKVAIVAHCPIVGVKVYVVVTVLFNAGDQVPVIPFKEVVANEATTPPEQIGGTAANVGTTFGFTVIVIVVVDAHCPEVGVKVYVVVVVLFNTGVQVPVIPFVDVAGNAAKAAPEQIGGTELKVGITTGSIVIETTVGVVEAHWPGSGVNV